MPPGEQGRRRAAAGEAGAADLPERVTGDGASAARRKGMLQGLGAPRFAAPALPRGMTFALSTGRDTLASNSDPRRSLESAS